MCSTTNTAMPTFCWSTTSSSSPGKERTQEEFFYTFNELHQLGHQIVLVSDRPPKDIKTLEDRLRTRFESGLITDISTPDFETRIAITARKAELLDLDIPDEMAEFIAQPAEKQHPSSWKEQ